MKISRKALKRQKERNVEKENEKRKREKERRKEGEERIFLFPPKGKRKGKKI